MRERSKLLRTKLLRTKLLRTKLLRTKLLRKAVYSMDEDIKGRMPEKNGSKGRMPEKNGSGGLEEELAYCSKLEELVESDQALCLIPAVRDLIPAVREKLNLLKETVEDTQQNCTLSKDMDARGGHKSVDSRFFGYKTHLAMTEERIIAAALVTSGLVTSGEKGDGPQLPKLLPISRDNGIQARQWHSG